jgi:hypothetical protein
MDFWQPKYSKWQCFLFGGIPGNAITWRPLEGKHPNFFWRWVQFLMFGNRWVKDIASK